jgi:hypothetical protein
MPPKDYDYDVPASLHKWPSFEKNRAGSGDRMISRPDATLADCVKEYMAKPDSQRDLYDIHLDGNILHRHEIEEIAKRSDFPWND